MDIPLVLGEKIFTDSASFDNGNRLSRQFKVKLGKVLAESSQTYHASENHLGNNQLFIQHRLSSMLDIYTGIPAAVLQDIKALAI